MAFDARLTARLGEHAQVRERARQVVVHQLRGAFFSEGERRGQVWMACRLHTERLLY